MVAERLRSTHPVDEGKVSDSALMSNQSTVQLPLLDGVEAQPGSQHNFDCFQPQIAATPVTLHRRSTSSKPLSCDLCTVQPLTFYGQHELSRHIDHYHTRWRKVWVCKDISADGTFLVKCQSCRSGKVYGAQYGAAAHLRRTHFTSCHGRRCDHATSREGRESVHETSMSILKHWMEEKYEVDGQLYSKEEFERRFEIFLTIASVSYIDDHIYSKDNFEGSYGYPLETKTKHGESKPYLVVDHCVDGVPTHHSHRGSTKRKMNYTISEDLSGDAGLQKRLSILKERPSCVMDMARKLRNRRKLV